MTPKSDVETHMGVSPEKISPDLAVDSTPLDETTKSRWERSWPTIACGAGLFSDGYLNGVCILIYFSCRSHALVCLDSEN